MQVTTGGFIDAADMCCRLQLKNKGSRGRRTKKVQACWRGRVATNREVGPRGIFVGRLRERRIRDVIDFKMFVERRCRRCKK